MKLALINDTTGLYGVYVRPTTGTNPVNTLIVSGQVTMVVPTGFQYTDFTDVNGSWEDTYTRVNAPPENPQWDYISVGFEGDSGTQLEEGEETLLFTFKRVGPCPDSIMHLIENLEDPFDIPNNSENTNPGNEITFVDFGAGLANYSYDSNYAVFAADCNDCDGDGLSNAQEDTNGDGVYTPGVDVSDMCNICDPFHPETATLSLQGLAENGLICADDLTDTAFIFVAVEGGWPPYTVVYTDGTTNFTVLEYNSNDTIKIIPTASASYSLVSITDSEGCVADIGGLGGVADITVDGPISIDVDPVSLSECSANGTGFSATVSNAGAGTIRYLWQVSTDGGNNFVDLENGTPYSTVMTNSMSISNVTGLNDYQYRVKVWTTVCDTTFSAPAILSVEGPLSFTTNPQSITVCGTNGTSFTAVGLNSGVGTMNSVWQISTNGGTSYTDLTNGGIYSGTTTNTLTISNTEGLNGYLYRMRIFSTECADVFSQAALLTVEGPFTITSQPQSDANCGGEVVTFVIEVDNPAAGTVLYQWQQNSGAGWVTLTNDGDLYNGVTTDTLSISDITGMDGDLVRVRISSATCSVILSDEVPITEEGSVNFTNNPDDFTTCDGSPASFTAEANTGGLNTPNYTWQVSNDDGVTFTDLSDGGVYSGTDALTLNISDVAGLYDNRYRIKGFSGLCDTTFSADAVLTVEGPLSIDVDPVDQTICSGETTSIPATITNAGSGTMTIQWQVSTNNGGLWSNIPNNATYNGVNTNNLSIENVDGLDGNQYRILIQSGTCAQLPSAAATLTVDGPITYSAQPQDVQICDDGTAVSFSATTVNATGNGAETYQWQISSDGINFAAIPTGAPYSNLTTTTMSISDVTGLNGRYYRLATSLGVCAVPFYSEAALLTVEGPIAIQPGGDPVDVTACSGEPITFIIGASTGGLGELLYQWQANDGSGWVNINNGPIYNGVQTDTLSIGDIVGLDGYQYRVVLNTPECGTSIFSAAATLTVEGPLVFTAEPIDYDQCSGLSAFFEVIVDNLTGNGTTLYQWQENDGSGWSDLSNGGVYSGADLARLDISNVAGLGGYQYRVIIGTATCIADISSAAVLNVEGPLSITAQPIAVTECSGEANSFSVTVNNPGSGGAEEIDYQWYISFNGTNWTALPNNDIYNGVHTSILSISDVAGLGNALFHVEASTANCSFVTSAAASLTVEGPLEFTDNPDNSIFCNGGAATTFSATVLNNGAGSANYQWQVSSDGVNFANLTDGAIYSGVHTQH